MWVYTLLWLCQAPGINQRVCAVQRQGALCRSGTSHEGYADGLLQVLKQWLPSGKKARWLQGGLHRALCPAVRSVSYTLRLKWIPSNAAFFLFKKGITYSLPKHNIVVFHVMLHQRYQAGECFFTWPHCSDKYCKIL